MKILVCVSKTPDTTSKISFTLDGTKFNEAGITFIMNPYDEWYALVRAIELVEKNGGSVTLIVWLKRTPGSGNHAIAGIWHEGTDLRERGPTAQREERGQRDGKDHSQTHRFTR